MEDGRYFDFAFVTNMRLLGFRGELTRDTFRRSNTKAFHDVMYFLFEKLDPAKTRQSFRDSWPVCSKKDEAAFRRVCSTWIQNIAKEDKNAQCPAHVGPLLIFPHGPKFVRFMMMFTRYVMFTDLMRSGGPKVGSRLSYPTVKPGDAENFAMASGVLVTAARENTALYVRYQEKRLQDFQAWKASMKLQVDLHKKLTKDLDLVKSKEKELLAHRERTASTNSCTQQSRSEAIEKISTCWDKLPELSKIDDESWEVLSPLLYGDIDRHCLDRDALMVEIPDVLLERAEELKIQQEDLDGLLKDDKLDLVKFAKFAQAAITLYFQKLKQNDPFLEMENMATSIEEELKRHAVIVERLEKLKADIITKRDQLMVSIAAHMDEALAGITLTDVESLPGEIIPQTPPLNIYGGVALSLGSPIQTPQLTPPSTVASDSSPDLMPQRTATPISRKFTRSCSPLLCDPLSSPAEHHLSGMPSNQLLAVITVGIKEKKQWTKVTKSVKPVNGEASSKPLISQKKFSPQTRIVGIKKVACNVVKPTKASGAVPKVAPRASAIPISRPRKVQTIGKMYEKQSDETPATTEIPDEEAFAVKELLPRTPASLRHGSTVIQLENAESGTVAAVSPFHFAVSPSSMSPAAKSGHKFDVENSFELEFLIHDLPKLNVASPTVRRAPDASAMDHDLEGISAIGLFPGHLECSEIRRTSSTPRSAASSMEAFLGPALDDFAKAIEDEGDSLLVGNEESGSLVSTDDDSYINCNC